MLSKDDYQNLLTENITKTYKMTNRGKVYDINNETKSIAKQISIDNRIERMYENKSYHYHQRAQRAQRALPEQNM